MLRKASEIEEREGSGGGGGLSMDDLQEIAREVGMAPEAISKAVDGLDGRGERTPMGGAPAIHKAVHAVRGELNDEALGQLIRLVDDETDSTGAISEALGSVRWTTGDRFHSMQVSLTPENGETVIQVVQKVRPRLRRVMQLLPAAGRAARGGAVPSRLRREQERARRGTGRLRPRTWPTAWRRTWTTRSVSRSTTATRPSSEPVA